MGDPSAISQGRQRPADLSPQPIPEASDADLDLPIGLKPFLQLLERGNGMRRHLRPCRGPWHVATMVPGERLSERARPMIAYLKMFEKSANVFPGFEAEIQGLYREVDETGAIRFHTYVVRE